jgi:DNA-binding protein
MSNIGDEMRRSPPSASGPVVFVGSKPIRNYLLAVLTLLGSSNKVTLKARGSAITKAVSIAQIAHQRDLVDIDKVMIGSDMLEDREGNSRLIGTIEIRLIRKSASRGKKT